MAFIVNQGIGQSEVDDLSFESIEVDNGYGAPPLEPPPALPRVHQEGIILYLDIREMCVAVCHEAVVSAFLRAFKKCVNCLS